MSLDTVRVRAAQQGIYGGVATSHTLRSLANATVQVIGVDQCNHAVTNSFTVTILPGPNCGNTNCIQFYSSNIVAYTCSNCTTVPFNTQVFDNCCSNVSLIYNPPTNTCFAVNTTTPVQVLAFDQCGNRVTNYITVTVLPDPQPGDPKPQAPPSKDEPGRRRAPFELPGKPGMPERV